MKVLHVIKKKMEQIEPVEGIYQFNDGDVYVVDNNLELYIWLGKDCSVDEKTVGAWIANKIDNDERQGVPTVYTIAQGQETEAFKGIININVIDADTPGFLLDVELDMVEYKLYRVYTKEDTIGFDEAFIEEVELDRSSLKSEDVFVLDGNDALYVWIGKDANREEKVEAQKMMRKIDADRHYLALQYTIYEQEATKSEFAFYNFLLKIKDAGPVVSVEDQRELDYVPESEPVVEATPEPEPEPEPVVEPTPEPEPEPVEVTPREPTPRPRPMDEVAKEPVVEVTPEPEPEPEPVVEATPEPEPEPVVEATPEPEPEPVVEPTPEPEPEPVVEPTPEPEPVVVEKTPEPVVAKSEPSTVVDPDTVKLYFIDGEFIINPKSISNANAILEISRNSEKVTLSFPANTGLIVRRTASRPAESIARSGFLLPSGERIAAGYSFEIIEADKLNEAHFRVGHSYNE
jgi:hypothetical protein